MEDCAFCKVVNGEISSDKVYEDDNLIVINDIKPIAKGHCLVIPKKHFKTILDIPSTLGGELIDVIKKQGLRLIKEKKAEGFNVIQNNFKAGGQLVDHFHVHIIPRKTGDKVKLN